MWENAYLSIKNPKASRPQIPQPQIAGFACATLLCYITNFRPQNLAPLLDQILDPHLLTFPLGLNPTHPTPRNSLFNIGKHIILSTGEHATVEAHV